MLYLHAAMPAHADEPLDFIPGLAAMRVCDLPDGIIHGEANTSSRASKSAFFSFAIPLHVRRFRLHPRFPAFSPLPRMGRGLETPARQYPRPRYYLPSAVPDCDSTLVSEGYCHGWAPPRSNTVAIGGTVVRGFLAP